MRAAEEKGGEKLRKGLRKRHCGRPIVWLLQPPRPFDSSTEAGEAAKGKRQNKQVVSGPAIRNAKFIRKTLIAKN